MEYAADRWVQRLRDGVAPRPWRVIVGSVVTAGIGVVVLVEEFTTPGYFDRVAGTRAQTSALLVPAVLVLVGIVVLVGSWSNGRRDRRTLARIRASGRTPAFFLPVTGTGIRASEDAPRPRATMWTVDDEGLHAWAAERPAPVRDVPWSALERIDLATKDVRGQRVDYALWLDLTQGRVLVLTPRAAIGRPFEAGQTKLDILMRVLRSLRRDLHR